VQPKLSHVTDRRDTGSSDGRKCEAVPGPSLARDRIGRLDENCRTFRSVVDGLRDG
jgi:hypothetical protein